MADSKFLCNLKEAQEIVNNKIEKDGYFTSLDELMYKISNKTPFERMLDGSFGWGSINEPVNFDLFKEES